MPRLNRTWILAFAPCSLLALMGCTGADPTEEQVGRARYQLAHPGPWSIPADTLAIGDSQYVPYTGAGPWTGEDACSGGITSGADIMRDYLYAHFPQTYSIGGYACRPIVGNESQMSVHGTGRALDAMINTIAGEADNDLGDPMGNWLIENAEVIGIQYIIWDLYTWQAARNSGDKGDHYGGSHPHNDHLHIELSADASVNTVDWFSGVVEPPELAGCVPVAAEGDIIDETDGCFRAFGPNEFWRIADGAGHDGSLLWTNAFENDEPANWARWTLTFEEAGEYRVEVYVDPAFGVYEQTEYWVVHGGGDEIVVVDQSSQQGWVELGSYVFNSDGDQHVSVFDNAPGPVAGEQRIAVDALRLTRLDGEGPSGEGGSDSTGSGGNASDPDDDFEAEAEVSCSCAAVGSPTDSNSGYLLGLLALAGLATRRRRR